MKKYNLISEVNDEPGGQELLNEDIQPGNEDSENNMDNIQEYDVSESDDQLWDGTESEFIADDESEEFEEQFTGTGIKLDYTLKYNEILDCLRRFSNYNLKEHKEIAMFMTMLGIGVLVYLLKFFVKGEWFNIVMLLYTFSLLFSTFWIIKTTRKNEKKKLKEPSIFSNIYPDNIVKKINNKVINGIAIGLIIGMIIFMIFANQKQIDLVMMLCFLLSLIALWVSPRIFVRNRAKKISNKQSIYAEIYPDNIVVGSNKNEYEIPLDGSSKFEEFENMFLIIPPEGSILIIPIRAIEPDFLPDVHAMLVAGTIPKDDGERE